MIQFSVKKIKNINYKDHKISKIYFRNSLLFQYNLNGITIKNNKTETLSYYIDGIKKNNFS